MSVRPPTRILVAEDDPDIGNLLDHYLKKAGFLPTVVTSGRDVMPQIVVVAIGVLGAVYVATGLGLIARGARTPGVLLGLAGGLLIAASARGARLTEILLWLSAVALAAALGNMAGAFAVVQSLRRELRVIDACLAFGAGFMLAVALLGVLPEVLREGEGGALYVLAGYLAVHLAQHVFTPHFHFGEETHRVSRSAGSPGSYVGSGERQLSGR